MRWKMAASGWAAMNSSAPRASCVPASAAWPSRCRPPVRLQVQTGTGVGANRRRATSRSTWPARISSDVRTEVSGRPDSKTSRRILAARLSGAGEGVMGCMEESDLGGVLSIIGEPRLTDRRGWAANSRLGKKRVQGVRSTLVGHGVGDVVEGDADAQRGVFLGIERIVGVLPGIAEVHVVAHGDYHAAAIVVDAAPVRDLSGLAFLVGEVGFQEQGAGDLKPFIEIVDGVKNRVAVGDVENGTVGKDAAHAFHENVPLDLAVKIVAHEEAAAEDELAEGAGLGVGEVPVADFDAVEERPVVGIAIVQVDDDFHAARVNAAEAAHGLGQVAVGAGIVHRPVGTALGPGAGHLEAAVDAAHRRIHEAAEGPFARLLKIAGDGKVVIPLHRGILAERALKGEHRGDRSEEYTSELQSRQYL